MWNNHNLSSTLLIFYTRWKNCWGLRGPRIRFSVSIFCIILLRLKDIWHFSKISINLDLAGCGSSQKHSLKIWCESNHSVLSHGPPLLIHELLKLGCTCVIMVTSWRHLGQLDHWLVGYVMMSSLSRHMQHFYTKTTFSNWVLAHRVVAPWNLLKRLATGWTTKIWD